MSGNTLWRWLYTSASFYPKYLTPLLREVSQISTSKTAIGRFIFKLFNKTNQNNNFPTKHKQQKTKDKLMKTTEPSKSNYKIEGEFLGFIPKPGGKPKYIQVQVGERIIPIKLAKELRETLGSELVEGDRLSIFLESQNLGRFSKLKLKSDRLERLDTRSESQSVASTFKSEKSDRGKILVCRQSSCSKRGGKQLYRALTQTLMQLGLQERVSIELTSCQKKCKQAPSLILMPGHVKHSYVHPNDLASLLKAHYL